MCMDIDQKSRRLTPLENLNCRVDILAKNIALQYIQLNATSLTPLYTTLGFGTVYFSKHLITGNIQSSLYRMIACNKLLSWQNLSNLSTGQINYSNISWNSFSNARKEARFGVNRFITKWMGESIASGKKMLQRQQRACALCPICHSATEDQMHILTCRSPKAKKHRLILLDDLASWFKSTHTNPDISTFFIQGLKTWFQNHTNQHQQHHLILTAESDVNLILSSQLKLGWYYSLCSFLSPSLITLQQSHYNTISSRRSSLRWATNLTNKLWEILYQIWCYRNDTLHSNSNKQLLSGLHTLKECISFEHELNTESLHPVYSSYFHIPLPSLLSKSNSYLKNWFLIIRTAREAYSSIEYDDDFCYNRPLRKWIGLSKLP